MKTKEQIDLEIAKLNELKPATREKSLFGDDHHAAIDAQVTVLSDYMDLHDIYESYGDESTDEFYQNVLDGAIAAYEWMMDGGGAYAAPSEGWSELTA
jgi:hypothetical protein